MRSELFTRRWSRRRRTMKEEEERPFTLRFNFFLCKFAAIEGHAETSGGVGGGTAEKRRRRRRVSSSDAVWNLCLAWAAGVFVFIQ